MAPHFKRQACSARRRVSGSSDLARALPTGSGTLWSPPSVDHPPRLPEPPAWLGCGDQPILGTHWIFCAWPPSGRHHHALQHRVAADRLRARHRLASCLLQVGLLFKSSRILDRQIQVHVPHQHVGADSSSCLPAYPGSHSLQSEATPAQHSRPRTSCTMMATEVKWTATSVVAHRQGEEPVGDDARGSRERCGENRGLPIGRSHCQCRSCSSTCLGAHQCLHLLRHPGEQVNPASFLHPGTGFVFANQIAQYLARSGRVPGVVVVSPQLLLPNWEVQRKRVLRLVLQLSDQLSCNQRNPMPPRTKGMEAAPTTPSPCSGDMWRILHRHSHTPASCL